MSKELEAIQVLKANAILFDDGSDYGASMLEAIEVLDEHLTPPTEQEVCKALSKWVKGNIPDIWNYKVYYDTGGFHYYNNCDFEEYLVEYEQIDKAITLSVFLPPHLVEMIGKFYKGKVKE